MGIKIIFYLARRYLFSRSLPTGVHLITWIAIISISVGTAALVVVLSVFNGLGGLLHSVFEKVEAPLRIVPEKGQYFYFSRTLRDSLLNVPGIVKVFPVIEGQALLRRENQYRVVWLKGVFPEYFHFLPLKDFLLTGRVAVKSAPKKALGVLGGEVAYDLRLNNVFEEALELMSLDVKRNLLLNPEEAVRSLQFIPVGVVSVQQQYDQKYVWLHYASVENLLNLSGKSSAVEVFLSPTASTEKVLKHLRKMLPPELSVLTINDLHPALYKVLRNEKWISFLLLCAMVLLIVFNVLMSLLMIGIAKQLDFGILRTFGLTVLELRQIFYVLSGFMGILAVTLGVFAGTIVVWTQEKFHWLSLGQVQSFIIDYLPMELVLSDVFIIYITILFLVSLSSLYPAFTFSRKRIIEFLR